MLDMKPFNCIQISLLKNKVTYKIFSYKSYKFIYKQNLTLNNHQGLIWDEIQPIQTLISINLVCSMIFLFNFHVWLSGVLPKCSPTTKKAYKFFRTNQNHSKCIKQNRNQ